MFYIAGSRDGAVAKALASYQCGLGSIPVLCHILVEFDVGSRLARSIWLFKMQEYRTPISLHLEKPIFQNYNLIRKEVRTWKPAKADVAFFLNI